MIKAAIFDIDGTILDSMPMWDGFAAMYLRKAGVEPEADLGKRFFHMTAEQSSKYLIKHYLPDKKLEDMLAEMTAIANRFYAEEVQLKPHMKEILDALRDEGLKLGIATVSNKAGVIAGLKRNGLLDYFGAIVTVAEVGVGKEDPAVFLEAAKQLGVTAAESCVFEDALHAAETAKMAGFTTIGVYEKINLHFQKELIEFCDFYLAENADVSALIRFIKQ